MKRINEQINPVFLQQTQKLAQFTKIIRAVLPAECLNHVKVANIRNQTLMLVTDSPVWTTRLRQLSPQILQFVQKNMPVSVSENTSENTLGNNPENQNTDIIHHLRISTRYQTANRDVGLQKKKSREKLHISQKTAELLSQSADSFDNDQLKTALSKLAAHAASPTVDKSKK
jgi:hypothetical protein